MVDMILSLPIQKKAKNITSRLKNYISFCVNLDIHVNKAINK